MPSAENSSSGSDSSDCTIREPVRTIPNSEEYSPEKVHHIPNNCVEIIDWSPRMRYILLGALRGESIVVITSVYFAIIATLPWPTMSELFEANPEYHPLRIETMLESVACLSVVHSLAHTPRPPLKATVIYATHNGAPASPGEKDHIVGILPSLGLRATMMTYELGSIDPQKMNRPYFFVDGGDTAMNVMPVVYAGTSPRDRPIEPEDAPEDKEET